MICPPFLRDQALKLGVAEADVDALWDSHVEHCQKQGRDYGGGMWRALCAKAAADGPRVPTIPRNDPEIARLKRLEREAKLLEEQEYLKTAVGFGEYAGEVAAAWGMYEPLSPAEAELGEHVDQHGLPPPGVDAVTWLLERIGHSQKVPRPHPCATCGQQARSWVREGRRYFGTLCEGCSAQVAKAVGS